MMTIVTNTVLMAPSGQGQSSPMVSLVFLLMIIVIFYFFMIRPQMKRQKEMVNYRNSLKKGDKVITTGGIYGKLTEVSEQTVSLEIADNVNIKVDKNAVLKDPADLNAQK